MKKDSTSKIMPTGMAAVLGFFYYYYIFEVVGFVNLNPHLVFFLVILMMYIISVILKKIYFVFILSVSALVFWVYHQTSVMEKLAELKWLLLI